ncbi:Hsp20/alpha crystallin family protein [Virgibacillus senegalensis]|uniref:Hsp20/alpha crystallin family protein n=1 Tax=Virgibacillus senegalensis TaxID=1499679 RepID=UPI00069CDDE1|nr:Hsp20/alpha crystallin family protein [Virgibacillus senegalensis]
MEKDNQQRQGRQPRRNSPLSQMEEYFKHAQNNGLLNSIDSLFQQPLFKKTSIAVDLYETTDEWVVEAEIPGVSKENIKIEPMGDRLKIAVVDDRETEETNDVNNYYRRERMVQGVERIVQLPYTIKKNKTKAAYRNGVLTIRGPKEARTSNQIDID